MNISVRSANGVEVLEFEGKLDAQGSAEAQAKLAQLIEAGKRTIVANFEKLDYINSTGIRVLVAVAKQLKAVDGELRICSLNEFVREVLDISGYTMIFKVFVSETEALEGL